MIPLAWEALNLIRTAQTHQIAPSAPSSPPGCTNGTGDFTTKGLNELLSWFQAASRYACLIFRCTRSRRQATVHTMRHPRRLVEGPYLHDLLAQPEAVSGTCRNLAEMKAGSLPAQFRDGAFDRVVLTGMGSSHHALQVAVPELAGTPLPIVGIETSELVHVQPGLLSKRTLLVAVSQSGESAEVLRLLNRIPDGSVLVGITNTPGSTLDQAAAHTLLTAAGPETTVACKTYLASVAALLFLSTVLQGGQPDSAAAELMPVADDMNRYLGADAERIYLTGRGTSLAAAGQGALTLKEAARFPAEAMSCAAFRHGPIEILGPTTTVVVLEGPSSLAPLNLRFLGDLRVQGGVALHLGRQTTQSALSIPDVPDRLLPLVEVLPLQLMSLALAALSGSEAGCFRFAAKITRAD